MEHTPTALERDQGNLGKEKTNVDMQNVTKATDSRQAPQFGELSETDRRLLVRASLTLLLRRINHGIPVLRSDLLRVAYYAPEEADAA